MSQDVITEVDRHDIGQLLVPGSERRQSLEDFDDYVDIVDYIVRSTNKIWEQRGIGRIYDHYRHNAVIHTSDGTESDRRKAIADLMKSVWPFPTLRVN